MDNKLKVFLIACMCMCLGALGPNGYKKFIELGTNIPPSVATMYLMFLGGLPAFIWLLVCDLRNDENTIKNNLRDFQNKQGVLPYLITSCFASALLYTLYVKILHTVTVTESTTLLRLSPFFGILLSAWFLKEKLPGFKNLSVALVLCIWGTIVLQGITASSFFEAVNLFMLIICFMAIAKAWMHVSERKVQVITKLSGLQISCLRTLGGSILLFIYNLSIGVSMFIDSSVLFILFVIGFVTIFLPVLLKLQAYSYAGEFNFVNNLDYFFPVIAAFIAFVWHGESMILTNQFWAGFVLISLGITVINGNLANWKFVLSQKIKRMRGGSKNG